MGSGARPCCTPAHEHRLPAWPRLPLTALAGEGTLPSQGAGKGAPASSSPPALGTAPPLHPKLSCDLHVGAAALHSTLALETAGNIHSDGSLLPPGLGQQEGAPDLGSIRIWPLLYFPAGTGAGSIPVPCPLRRKPISVYAVCFSLFVCLLNTLLTEGGDSGDSANAAELRQRGWLAWGRVVADPRISLLLLGIQPGQPWVPLVEVTAPVCSRRVLTCPSGF